MDPAAKTVEVMESGPGGLVELGKLTVGQELTTPLTPGLSVALDEIFR